MHLSKIKNKKKMPNLAYYHLLCQIIIENNIYIRDSIMFKKKKKKEV